MRWGPACEDEQGWKIATSAILRAMLRHRLLPKTPYLNPRWLAAKLLPALDPSLDPAALRARSARTREER